MDGMISMFGAAALALLVTMGLALIRLLVGPSLFDRVLAVNMFGTKTVLLIAVLGFLTGRPEFLDLALVYVLIRANAAHLADWAGGRGMARIWRMSRLSIWPRMAPISPIPTVVSP